MDIHGLEAIFWDFDGVLLDSTRVKSDAFQAMFAPYGETVVERVLQHHRKHGGISRVEKLAHYYRDFLGQPLTETALAEKCREFSARVLERVICSAWIPGAEAFLEIYHACLAMFVISGTPQDELELIVQRRKMERYFKGGFGSPQPKSEHLRRLLHERGYDPGRCLFLGDAMTDYRAALETGVLFIGIQGAVPFPAGTVVLPDCTLLASAIREF